MCGNSCNYDENCCRQGTADITVIRLAISFIILICGVISVVTETTMQNISGQFTFQAEHCCTSSNTMISRTMITCIIQGYMHSTGFITLEYMQGYLPVRLHIANILYYHFPIHVRLHREVYSKFPIIIIIVRSHVTCY